MRSTTANNNLNTITLCRTVEGVRLAKAIDNQNRPAQLILSGSKDTGTMMRNTAVMLGIPKNQTIVAPPAKDTYGQAQSLKSSLAKKPFILVTSATHMARAMALFKKANLHPIAAPSCFTYRTTRSPKVLNVIPMASTVARFNLSWHGVWVYSGARLAECLKQPISMRLIRKSCNPRY